MDRKKKAFALWGQQSNETLPRSIIQTGVLRGLQMNVAFKNCMAVTMYKTFLLLPFLRCSTFKTQGMTDIFGCFLLQFTETRKPEAEQKRLPK